MKRNKYQVAGDRERRDLGEREDFVFSDDLVDENSYIQASSVSPPVQDPNFNPFNFSFDFYNQENNKTCRNCSVTTNQTRTDGNSYNPNIDSNIAEANSNGDLLSNGNCVENEEKFPIYFSKQNSRRYSSYKSYRHQTRGSKRIIRRLIAKSGSSNIIRKQNSSLWDRYFRDLGHTLVSGTWKWTIFALTSCFMLSWTIFATAWMLIATSNGDTDPDNPSPTPCLSGITGFAGYMMFSLETQQTIGYGSRYPNHYCPEGTFMMCLQMCLSGAICGGMVCIVNAKMVRPLQQFSKNLFSKRALISLRDGELCLIFRVRDDKSRYAIGTSINAYLVQSRVEEPFLKSLTLEPFGLLLWPLEVVHRITPNSPFWDLSAKELVTKRFEMIVTMTGTSAVTGQCSKSRTSYLSTEILWGGRFKPCVHYDYSIEPNGQYFVDHKLFDAVEETSIPLCSAQRFSEVIQEITTPLASPEEEYKDFVVDDLERDEDTILPIEIYGLVNDMKRDKDHLNWISSPSLHSRNSQGICLNRNEPEYELYETSSLNGPNPIRLKSFEPQSELYQAPSLHSNYISDNKASNSRRSNSRESNYLDWKGSNDSNVSNRGKYLEWTDVDARKNLDEASADLEVLLESLQNVLKDVEEMNESKL